MVVDEGQRCWFDAQHPCGPVEGDRVLFGCSKSPGEEDRVEPVGERAKLVTEARLNDRPVVGEQGRRWAEPVDNREDRWIGYRGEGPASTNLGPSTVWSSASKTRGQTCWSSSSPRSAEASRPLCQMARLICSGGKPLACVRAARRAPESNLATTPPRSQTITGRSAASGPGRAIGRTCGRPRASAPPR